MTDQCRCRNLAICCLLRKVFPRDNEHNLARHVVRNCFAVHWASIIFAWSIGCVAFELG